LQALKRDEIIEKIRKSLEDRLEARKVAVASKIRPNVANVGRVQQMASPAKSDKASILSEQTIHRHYETPSTNKIITRISEVQNTISQINNSFNSIDNRNK
jgi:hypothetical protein